jgi:hypothetical protein
VYKPSELPGGFIKGLNKRAKQNLEDFEYLKVYGISKVQRVQEIKKGKIKLV